MNNDVINLFNKYNKFYVFLYLIKLWIFKEILLDKKARGMEFHNHIKVYKIVSVDYILL